MKRKALGYALVGLMILTRFSSSYAGDLHPILRDQIQAQEEPAALPTLIVLNDQVDLDQLHEELRTATRQERHQRVIEACQHLAERTQRDLITHLEAKKAAGLVDGYRSYWITNAISVLALPEALLDLVDHPDIKRIYPRIPVEPIGIDHTPSAHLRELDPALDLINVRQCWERGITGRGTLVGSFDTGVDLNHDALTASWRGNFAPAEECWLDWRSAPSEVPQPWGSYHGTRTTGNILGVTESDTVGVAIDALWIAANTISHPGWMTGDWDDEIIATYQWFADPDSNPATIEDVPDVVNNSWGVHAQWPGGYYDFCYDAYWEAMDNCEAAGVILTYASGNAPSSWSYRLKSPADRATTPTNSFAVGAVDSNLTIWIRGSGNITWIGSGGGYSLCTEEFPLRIKPEVTAPGVDVRTLDANDGYSTGTGTSISVALASGTLALMRQVNPDITSERAKEILMETALDLGEAGEDTLYGWGCINAYAAVQATFSTLSSVQGTVTDARSGVAIEGVMFTIADSIYTVFSTERGQFDIRLPAGTHVLNIYHPQYQPAILEELAVGIGDTLYLDVQLTPLFDTGTIEGIITDGQLDLPLPNTGVFLVDNPAYRAQSDSTGFYRVEFVPVGSHTIQAQAGGFDPQTAEIQVEPDQITEWHPALVPYLSFEADDGGFMPDGTPNLWMWGISDTLRAYHGDHLWTTGLNGGYEAGTYWLETGTYALGVSENPYLKVYHHMATNSVADGGQVNISTDGGSSWQLLHPDPDYPQPAITGLGNEPGYSGVFDWQPMIFPLEAYQNETVRFRFEFGAMANAAQSGWALDYFVLNSRLEMVNVQRENTVTHVPLMTRLGRNYPNPFNPQTTLPYDLAVSGDVYLRIYNLHGQLVRTWVFEEQPAGVYQVQWDGMDSSRQKLSSGVYFYQLEVSNGFQQTEKMILLR